MSHRSPHIFSAITWFNAIAGILLLAYQWSYGSIPSSFQMGFFLVMVGATGIPHGALDHIIARNNSGDEKGFSIQQFLKKYILAIVAYSICWIWMPSISLLIFLLISAWHFGETDLAAVKGNTIWNGTGRMLCGIFILMIILLTHPEETLSVIRRITKEQEYAMNCWFWCVNNKWLLINLTGSMLTMFVTLSILQKSFKPEPLPTLNLMIILVLCSQLPLLPSFGLYFGGWHAIRSFEITYRFLHEKKDVTATDPITLWKNALPMTFLAAFGFIFMAYIWTGLGIKTDPIPALFIFLSIITLPHLDVMDDLIRSHKKPIR